MSATEVSLFSDYFDGLLAKVTTDPPTPPPIVPIPRRIVLIPTTHTTDTTTHITGTIDIDTEDRNSDDYSYFGSFDIANTFLMDAIYRYLGKGRNTATQIENFRAMVIRDGLDTKIIPVKFFFQKLL